MLNETKLYEDVKKRVKDKLEGIGTGVGSNKFKFPSGSVLDELIKACCEETLKHLKDEFIRPLSDGISAIVPVPQDGGKSALTQLQALIKSLI